MEYGEMISKKTFALYKFPIFLNSFLNLHEIDLLKGSIRLIMRQTFYRPFYSACRKFENNHLEK